MIGVSIDGGEMLPCELHVEREMVDVSTNLPQPDPNWSAVDSNGHFHAYNQTGAAGTYPTLTEKSQHRDCGGRCGGDPDECDGWIETWYECAICGERVQPGSIPGPHYRQDPGRYEWWVDVRSPAPIYPADRVSVRVTSEGRESFGIALVERGPLTSNDPTWPYRLRGISPLGSRPA